jgi:hypothetical protein
MPLPEVIRRSNSGVIMIIKEQAKSAYITKIILVFVIQENNKPKARKVKIQNT